MTLNEVKANTKCFVKEINIFDEPTKIRIMELGVVPNVKISIIKKSLLKKTLLIAFASSLFTIKSSMAQSIVVEYA